MGNLTLSLGGTKFVLTPSAQLFPVGAAAAFAETGSDAVSILAYKGSINTGYDVILGQMMLERFYSVYDSANSKLGFATTAYTYQHTTEVSLSRRTRSTHVSTSKDR